MTEKDDVGAESDYEVHGYSARSLEMLDPRLFQLAEDLQDGGRDRRRPPPPSAVASTRLRSALGCSDSGCSR